MTPDQMDNIDRVIEQAIPELKFALMAVMQGEAIHAFTMAIGRDAVTGIECNITLFLAHESPGKILEGAARGFGEAQKLAVEQMHRIQEAGHKAETN